MPSPGEEMRRLWRYRETALFAVSTVLLLAGLVAVVSGARAAATAAWVAATALGLGYSTVSVVDAVRRRRPSVDVIAWLALVGALGVGEAFAGAMVAVMLASGLLLEARAAARSRRELSLLAQRAPRSARRLTPDGVALIPVGEVARGDRVLVGSGEVVPVDGRLAGPAVLDESTLTGEPLPVERRAGEDVRSGVVNAGSPFELLATALAAESTYAGLVRLVEQTRAESAPFVRTADRFAVAFVPLTLLLAGAAWAVTGQPVRAVAVLVVATPCPLLLAAPIAIMSGLSQAARAGVVIKGGSALERLAAGRILLFDKTGTLTRGRPVLTRVATPDGGLDPDELLRLAASLDQVSAHVLAGAIVTAARERRLAPQPPAGVREYHGYGVEGDVGGHRVRLGKAGWVLDGLAGNGATGNGPTGNGATSNGSAGDSATRAWVRQVRRRAALDGSLTVLASVDGIVSGALFFEDPVRPDAPRMIRSLRAAGVRRIVLLTGDRADTAETVGRIVGVDAVHAERDPADKLAIIRTEQAAGPTVMAGDGINDAPALAAADVGVALAARGAPASAAAADVVLTVDRIDGLADAILIARRARRIAVRAVLIGMGLSLAAMVVAAGGRLPPAAGAVLQELIDVAAIAIALTAVLPARRHTVTMAPADVATARRLYAEHRAVQPVVEQLRVAADALTTTGCDLNPVRALLYRLETDLLPHERAEEAELLPIVARTLGGADPTGALSRTHAEIEHQISRLRRLLDELGAGAEAEDAVELRRLLYGLYAILRLHNAQEEEGAFSLVSTLDAGPDGAGEPATRPAGGRRSTSAGR
jgi:heavy metal translocating P-type ATPase